MNKVFLASLVLVAACNAPGTENAPKEAPTPHFDGPASGWHRLDLPGLDDNVKSDTLLIQTTFQLPDGRFVMVAGPMDETSREGLHLYLYTPNADSTASVIARSKPGYDSYTMLPTFFASNNAADGLLLLANMGERDSWGQEVFWLKDDRFIHLGFLDVAERRWTNDGDSAVRKLVNIGPVAHVSGAGGSFHITFGTDSVFLYDDLQGHTELMLPSARVGYTCAEGQATLILDGKPIQPQRPS